MKQQTYKIGEPVIFKNSQTYIRGYHSKDKNLFIVEDEKGWFGWCILDSGEVESGNNIIANKQYTLAYGAELKRAEKMKIHKTGA